MQDDNKQNINIEISEEVAQGIYSNLAMIAHSPSEFVLDFIQMLPGMPKAKVKSRVIMTPEHAKRLLLALEDNIKKYEAHFGEITLQAGKNQHIPYSGPMGEA
ncbi:DUF3467 domain-containing protein [Thermonema rossianum]|jgi:hypothetical protein|uniref:DUF3467 domain-containing protein n=1 Tax=Thermonema rossianum TaxID=55505 RepID=UPI000570D20D|nr:DUF3467 domain-containing protein [Thermonema rossianum]